MSHPDAVQIREAIELWIASSTPEAVSLFFDGKIGFYALGHYITKPPQDGWVTIDHDPHYSSAWLGIKEQV